MGIWEFDWQALPERLVRLMPAEYVSAGRLPDSEMARHVWASVRDEWLLTDPARARDFAALLDSLDVARTTRERAADDIEFITELKNTAGLRHALVRYLLGLGSVSAPSAPTTAHRPEQRHLVAEIPSEDFAPRTSVDFSRLSDLNDLEWGYWLLRSFGAIEDLLPGESLVIMAEMPGPANSGAPTAAAGFMFSRVRDDMLEVLGGPQDTLPEAVTYEPLRQRLVGLGWGWTTDDRPQAEFPWPDGIDDALMAAMDTFRSVFLVDTPLRMYQSEEFRPPDGLLPAAPLPTDVVRPSGPEEVLSVIDSIIRAMGGWVLSDVDPTTHGFRLGDWSGWIHADPAQPILDAVLIALDSDVPEPSRLDPTRILQLQEAHFRFGRIVVSGTQTLVAGSIPCHCFTGNVVEVFLRGLIDDAAACIGISEPATVDQRSIGGYL